MEGRHWYVTNHIINIYHIKKKILFSSFQIMCNSDMKNVNALTTCIVEFLVGLREAINAKTRKN